MNYIVYTKDFVIYQIADRSGIADHKEIRSLFMGARQPVAVAVEKTTPKVFEIEDKSTDIEKIITNDYSGGFMVQHEKLDANKYQAFGIEKALINNIHRILEPEEVELITPYALAIRRYIESLNIDSENRYILFIEYIKERNTVLLSFFYNRRHYSTRTIKYRPNTFRSEIIRDIQGFSSGIRTINFICISNSEELANTLIDNGVFKRNEVIFSKETYPSIKGIEIGYDDFPHFMSESKLLEKEAALRHRRDLTYISASFIIFIISILGWGICSLTLNKKEMKVAALQSEIEKVKTDIIEANREKYINYISVKGGRDLSGDLARFYNALPPGSALDSLTVNSADGESFFFTAFLIKKDITSRIEAVEKALKIFPGAIVENVVIKDMLGYKVTIKLGDNIDYKKSIENT